MDELKSNSVKAKTLELYRQLPQEKEARQKRLDIRDQIIELNYTFFGYVATHTFINNPTVTYEDKFQSAVMHFCTCWWWYQWKGDSTHKGYRDDLSFAVFFKPRIGEMIERELNQVKYSIRRTLCMEVGKQLGKHWGQVRYEDLSQVNLPVDKMNSLKAIFGSLYIADLDSHSMYMPAPSEIDTPFAHMSDEYDSLEELLIHEMVDIEQPLSDSYLQKMSEMYDIPFVELKAKYPAALNMLYKRLHDNLDLKEITTF